MVLMNLMSITDKTIPMTIYIKSGNTGRRYNFTANQWEDSKLTAGAIINVGDFLKTAVYREIRKYTLVTFSVQKTETLSGLTDEDKAAYPKILTITIAKDMQPRNVSSGKGRTK